MAVFPRSTLDAFDPAPSDYDPHNLTGGRLLSGNQPKPDAAEIIKKHTRPDGKINWSQVLLALAGMGITTGIGAAVGGGRGALTAVAEGLSGLTTGYERGAERREQNILNQEETGFRRAHEERRTKAAERQADALEDKAGQEKWTWDSRNRVFASNKGAIKQPATEVPAPPAKEEKGVYDKDRGVIVFPTRGEIRVLEGLPAKQFAPPRPATPKTPTPAPWTIDKISGHKMGWNPKTGDYDIDMGLGPQTGKDEGKDEGKGRDWGAPIPDKINPLNAAPGPTLTSTPEPGRTPAPMDTTIGFSMQEEVRLRELTQKAMSQDGNLEGPEFDEYERLRIKRLRSKNAPH